jgi:cell division protease FtsH
MVTRFGMSERLGPLTYARDPRARFLAGALEVGESRDVSDETARAIDSEIRALIENEHTRARTMLEEHRANLDRIAHELLTHETLQRAELEALVAKDPARVQAA